jgi:toxin YoeB
MIVSWAAEDKNIFARIGELIRDVSRDPFRGIDKPEPLKHDLSGYWSSRIPDEHRLVHKVEKETIFIVS